MVVLVLAVTMFSFVILNEKLGDSPTGSNEYFLLGMLFGMALLVSGYTPWRNRRNNQSGKC
jgi:hypothetical protein